MNSSRVVFNFSLIAADYQYSLSVAQSFARFTKLYLYGYEFRELEENSFCVFRPFQMDADLQKAGMTRIYLNSNHPCSCFPILAFKYHRDLNGYGPINSSLEFLNDAPRCLKELYRNVSDTQEREAACEALYLTRCVKSNPLTTTAPQPLSSVSAVTAAQTTSSKERDNALIAIIVSSSIGAVCVILMLVLIVIVCRLNYRNKLNSQTKTLSHIEKKTQEIEQSFERFQTTYSKRIRAHQQIDDLDSDSVVEMTEKRQRRGRKKRTERKRPAGSSSKAGSRVGVPAISTVSAQVQVTSF